MNRYESILITYKQIKQDLKKTADKISEILKAEFLFAKWSEGYFVIKVEDKTYQVAQKGKDKIQISSSFGAGTFPFSNITKKQEQYVVMLWQRYLAFNQTCNYYKKLIETSQQQLETV
ncbi:hypothetical protein [Culicoidibacter larvae]|uniref:Uncharacterized protein n=1 Tax=Culicoidibacter larvae TaxID=2579976 RepID=A0A5R8Q8N6_9FIRM|nr:hypothetical protein [Culicoidibacter larvae]TLG71164.1 hypothetical protein FEZ08_11460 [Culicoidibacter larvae]